MFKNFRKMDWILWLLSISVVLIANIIVKDNSIIAIVAPLLGVTSLIFAAKGNVIAQFLMIIFSILYGAISYEYRYWGELITYVGMTMPMAIWSAVTWLKNPSTNNKSAVKIQHLSHKQWILTILLTMIITILFYFILGNLGTPNMFFSTLSITTTFMAAMLTMLRSSYFALFYALNDIVLIILWIFASKEDPTYVPIVANFGIFLINDLYGFICWKKRENKGLR